MKPIKVAPIYASAIEEALKDVNGCANDHAYTTFDEIEFLADDAEERLARTGLTQAQRVGATWTETSGGPVSNSYARKGFSRPATTVTIERRRSGWYVTSISKATINLSGGGDGVLTLSPAQDDECVRRLRITYRVDYDK